MEKLKICYVLPTLNVSGGVAVVFQHLNRLAEKGHYVVAATLGPVEPTDWFPGQIVPTVTIDNVPKDLDVLVATAWSTAFHVSKLTAKKKFYFVQSDETRFHEKDSCWYHITLLSYLMNYNVFTEARWIKKWLKENFGKEAEVIPNGLDGSIFYPVSPLSRPKNRPRILLEGAIGLPYKGMELAFNAVKDLDVEVWCVSSYGSPESHWKCHRFFERVPMTKMREIYSSCDILLKMSKVEGFFGPPLEMMACGGVPIVAKVTGYDEYIVNEYNALVVDMDDVNGAREAVRKLINDKELFNRLSSNGIKTAREWDWDGSVDKLERFFIESQSDNDQFNHIQFEINKSISFFYDQLFSNKLAMPATEAHQIIFNKLGELALVKKLSNHLYYHYHKNRKFYRRFMKRLTVSD